MKKTIVYFADVPICRLIISPIEIKFYMQVHFVDRIPLVLQNALRGYIKLSKYLFSSVG